MKAYERLLKYAVIKTPSDESSDSTPSSACQFDLANLFKRKEMEELVVSNIQLTDNCFLYGKLPATKDMRVHLLLAYRPYGHCSRLL
mgnify:CR=1 FL=1